MQQAASSSNDDLVSFYEDLQEVLDDRISGKFIVMDDINAKIGIREDREGKSENVDMDKEMKETTDS